MPSDMEKHADAAIARGVAQDAHAASADQLTLQLLEMIRALQDQMATHMAGEGEVIQGLLSKMSELSAKTDMFLRAFPDGDPRAHCEYHEMLIAAMRDKSAFWQKMRYDLARLGLAGFAAWTLYALWKAFLMGPR